MEKVDQYVEKAEELLFLIKKTEISTLRLLFFLVYIKIQEKAFEEADALIQ